MLETHVEVLSHHLKVAETELKSVSSDCNISEFYIISESFDDFCMYILDLFICSLSLYTYLLRTYCAQHCSRCCTYDSSQNKVLPQEAYLLVGTNKYILELRMKETEKQCTGKGDDGHER